MTADPSLAHTSTDPDILAELSRHPDLRIRRRVCLNPHTSQQTLLERFHTDTTVSVICAAASHPAFDPGIYEALLGDDEALAGELVRRTTSTVRPSITVRLAQIAARRAPSRLLDVAVGHSVLSVRLATLRNPEMSARQIIDVLQALQNRDSYPYLLAARHRNVHPSTLVAVASQTEDEDLVIACLNSPNMPVSYLHTLTADSRPGVAAKAASRLRTRRAAPEIAAERANRAAERALHRAAAANPWSVFDIDR